MFSCKYCEFFKTPIYFEDYLRTAASESKAEFVQKVQKSATFSNIAQTRLLLCKFAEELHFWTITLWTWVIYVPLMLYVLIVILFVKQNILILFKRNARVTKTTHMWKNLLIFFFSILIIDIFDFWRCSTEGAAQELRFKLMYPRK